MDGIADMVEPAPTGDPLDDLLKLIVKGYFVLTDGQGAVSKWSDPADLIFGRSAEETLGHLLFESVIAPPVPPAAQAWRGFLEQGVASGVPARVEVGARHARGDEQFGVELYFVPVKLDEGFDFSLFLEDLGFELPMNLMLLRMRQQHPVVIRALGNALLDEAQPWENWRTAGTLVVFRPVGPTPWVEDQLRRREQEREVQAREIEDAMELSDPGVHGESVVELDDAAAVVARMIDGLERLARLEEVHAALPLQLEEARARAEGAESGVARLRQELDELARQAPAPEDEAERAALVSRIARLELARSEAEQQLRELRGTEALRAELQGRLEALEAAHAGAARAERAEALEQRLAHVEAEREGSRAELEERLRRLEAEREAAGDPGASEGALAAALERVEATQRAIAHEAEEARARVDGLRAQGDELRAEAGQTREETAQLRAQLAALIEDDGHRRSDLEHIRRETDELRGRLDEVRRERDEARHQAARIVEQVDDLRRRVEERAAGHRDGEETVEMSQVTAIVDGAVGNVDALRAEAEAVQHRLEALAREAAVALERAEEARAEAAGAREEIAEVRGEAREAQRSAREIGGRIDQVDRGAGNVLAEVGVLRERVDESLTQARAAHEAVEARRSEADQVLESVARLGAELEQAVARTEQVERSVEGAAAIVDDVAGLRADLDARVDALDSDADVLRERLGAALDRLNSTQVADSPAIDAVRSDAAQAADAVAAARAEIDELRTQADELRRSAAEAGEAAAVACTQAQAGDERLDAMGEQLEAVLGQLHDYRRGFDEARQAAVIARREAEQARRAAEEARADDGSQATEKLNAMVRELVAAQRPAAARRRESGIRRRPSGVVPSPAKATEPARPPREGFDDVEQPLALLDLSGRFRELNPAFARLVGYEERAFTKAVWPSVHDRQVYKEQQAQLEQLRAGEIPSVHLTSTYLHGQGLMVLVIGQLELVRDESGAPTHLLLRAEERQAGG